jgi:hypothetical protein
MDSNSNASTWELFRHFAIPSAVAAMAPLPILLLTNRPDIACLYMGLGCAWFSGEVFRFGGLPRCSSEWNSKAIIVSLGVLLIAALFIAFGIASGASTRFPFPAMAVLSTTPALGLIPWLVIRLRNPFHAIVFACFIVGSAKIAACLVARLVYGPNFIEEGYVAADWRTAKLMISLFWTFTAVISLFLLMIDFWRFHRLAPRTHEAARVAEG